MKKVIVDFKKLNDEILELLVAKYPEGYDEGDIITFRNAQNEVVECVEVRTEDTMYLVKISKRLIAAMEDFEIDDDNDRDPDDNDDILMAEESTEDDD